MKTKTLYQLIKKALDDYESVLLEINPRLKFDRGSQLELMDEICETIEMRSTYHYSIAIDENGDQISSICIEEEHENSINVLYRNGILRNTVNISMPGSDTRDIDCKFNETIDIKKLLLELKKQI